MNNINRFQGQVHRLGGNQNLNQGRARQVGQQAAQVAANAPLPPAPAAQPLPPAPAAQPLPPAPAAQPLPPAPVAQPLPPAPVAQPLPVPAAPPILLPAPPAAPPLPPAPAAQPLPPAAPNIQALLQPNAQAAQVDVNAPQANAQVAVQQPLPAPPVAQPLPAAQGLQVLAQQNLQAMQVNNPVQNNNQRMANFVQDVIREYGPLPENVERLTNPQMDNFVFDRNRLQDVGNLVTYLKDVIKNANITSAQCFNALPNEDGYTILNHHWLGRQQDLYNQCTHLNLDENDEIFVDENKVEYVANSDGLTRRVEIRPRQNNITNNQVDYINTPTGSRLVIKENENTIVTVINARHANIFTQNSNRCKQSLEFNDQGILTSHLIQDTRQDRSYDVLRNRITMGNRVIVPIQNHIQLEKFVAENIMRLAADNNQVNYNGTNINIPFNQVNRTGTMKDLIGHHKEVMSQLHKNGLGIIDDGRKVVDLIPNGDRVEVKNGDRVEVKNGDRVEAIDGNWNKGYIYYNEDGNKKYEYIKNMDGQGNNQIITYHEDIEKPSFDIVTQSNLEKLESATYTYSSYDRLGDTGVQNEQIVNNDVADTIAFHITPIINQLATNDDRATVAEINALLLEAYKPEEVFHTIESIR